MDQLLEQARSIYEGEIDFPGQRLADTLSTLLLTLSGLLAFLVGYSTQNIHHTLQVGLGGAVLTVLVVVPPWPFFKTAPERWLPARTGRMALVEGISGVRVQVGGEGVR